MKKQPLDRCHFVPAAPDELQIDLDRPRARIPAKLLRLVREQVAIRSVKYSCSRSGNTHCTIKLRTDDLSYADPKDFGNDIERLFLQVALGDDPVRALLSWGRARNGSPHPVLFFEKKLDKPRDRGA
jgi:hypothetical protein